MYVAFYSYYPTGSNKFRDLLAFKAFATTMDNLSLTFYDKRAELCIVSNSTGYIDFIANSESAKDIYSFTGGVYCEVQQQENVSHITSYSNFIAFTIDRLEVNNFNTSSSRTFRAYFTIDWLTTYLLWGYNYYNLIYGNVARGHVNDLLSADNETSMVMLDNRNTTIDCEVDIPRVKKDSKPFSNYQFLYIISTKTPDIKWGFKATYYRSPSYDKIMMKGYVCYCVPLTEIVVRIQDLNNISIQQNWIGDLSYYPDSFTDSSIVFMTISHIPPKGFDEETGTLVVERSGGIENNFEDNLTKMDVRGDLTTVVIPIITFAPIVKELESDYIIASSNFSIPKSFGELVEICPKAHFYPYLYEYIEASDKKILIDNANITNKEGVKIGFTGDMGSYYVYQESEYKKGEERYDIIPNYGLFPATQINDTYTRINAFTEGAVSAANVVGGIVNIPKDYGMSTVSSLTKFVGTTAQIHKTLRDGENGTKVSPNAYTNEFDPLRVVKVEPVNYEQIKTDLTIYGVFTYLNTDEILAAHLRSYYNFIRCENVSNKISLSREIQEQINSAFMNGLFLWSEKNFKEFTPPTFYSYAKLNLPIRIPTYNRS